MRWNLGFLFFSSSSFCNTIYTCMITDSNKACCCCCYCYHVVTSFWFAAIWLDASAYNCLWELTCPPIDPSYILRFFAASWRTFCFVVSFLWANFIWSWHFILLLIYFVWSSAAIWFAVTFLFLPLRLWATVLTTVCAAASAVCRHEGTVLFAFSFLCPVGTMRIFIDTAFCKRNFARTVRSNYEFWTGC